MTDSEGNEIGKLFIGGLSQATNNASLRVYFSRFGEVDDAVVMMDNKTGRSRGFGYVKYREPEAVMLALEAKPHILDGKEVDAKQCNINMKGRNRRSLKIFVGGIGLDQDAESIKNFFRQFGRVTDVNLMMDSNKQRHRGFAFVGFEDESVVKRLISLHYVMMNTKQVEIKAMEPPNFGRKVMPNGCLTAAALMNSATPTDGSCGQTFENSPDCNNMLSASFVNTIPYIPTQPPAIPCLPTNLMTPTRAHPAAGLYEPNAGPYNASLENLYQTTAILQPIGHSNKVFEPIQSSGPYMGSRQSVPFVVTGGQNQPTAINQNGAPLYTTFPYQLIPSTYIPSQQQATVSGVNQLVGTSKTASTWPSPTLQAGPLTICPSHITTTNNLISCPPYAPAHASTLQNSQQADINGAVTSVIAPYYTLCPQYAAVPLQNEQALATAYTVPPVPTSMTQLKVQGNTTNEATISSGSQSPTPANDSRLEQNKASKLAYPAVVMPSPGGLQNSALVAPSGHAIGQNFWNQPHSNLVYSPLQVGWTLHTNSQQTVQQNWASANNTVPQLQSATCFDAAITKPANPISEESQQKIQDNEVKQQTVDTVKSAQAKASGDGLDNVISTNQESKNLDYNSNGRVNSVDLIRIPETMNDQVNKSTGESRIWPPSDNLLSSASWSESSTKWTEENQSQCNFNPPAKNSMQPWNTQPVGLDDDRMSERPLGENFAYSNSAKQSSIQPKMAQMMRGAAGPLKGDKTTSESVCPRVTQQKTMGHNLQNATPSAFQALHSRTVSNTQTNREDHGKSQAPVTHTSNDTRGTDTYSDYTTWLYRKSAVDTGSVDKNLVERKELQSNTGVELECQGPAGAAGDFHRPVHTSQYTGYRVAR